MQRKRLSRLGLLRIYHKFSTLYLSPSWYYSHVDIVSLTSHHSQAWLIFNIYTELIDNNSQLITIDLRGDGGDVVQGQPGPQCGQCEGADGLEAEGGLQSSGRCQHLYQAGAAHGIYYNPSLRVKKAGVIPLVTKWVTYSVPR